MSEQQEKSENRSYIQIDDIVLLSMSPCDDICKIISMSGKDNNVLYMRSIRSSYSVYEKPIQHVSLLIPKEGMSFQYKIEDDMLLAYNNGQLVMSIYCPSYYELNRTKDYVNQMSDSYALRQLKDTCKNKKVLELLKTISYRYE